jgi:hypothetical protein
MADEDQDVLQVYEEVIARFTGAGGVKAPEGFIVSLRPMALPVNPEDYMNPWHPADGAPVETGDAAVDAAAVEKINRSKKAGYNLSLLLDAKLMMDGSGQAFPAASTVSQTWEAIVNGANAKALPALDDPVQKKAIEDATKLIYKEDPEDAESMLETKSYQNYKLYRKNYYKAVTAFAAAWQAAQASPAKAAAFPVTGKEFLSDVESAMEDWVGLGKKNKIEDALNLLGAQGTNVATAVIRSAKKLFDVNNVTYAMTGATSQYVQIQPSNWCDPAAEHDGWTEYHYKKSDSTKSTSTQSKSWSAGGGVSTGFWSAKANASQTKDHTHVEASTAGLEIQFKIAAVDIFRPGMSMALLNLGNWYLKGGKAHCISSGKAGQPKPDADEPMFLPGEPTQLLVIKNLKFKTANTNELLDELKKTTEAGGSVGYGPFSISGKYKNATSEAKSEMHEAEGWINVDGVQIIGYVSQINPQSPRIDDPALATPA